MNIFTRISMLILATISIKVCTSANFNVINDHFAVDYKIEGDAGWHRLEENKSFSRLIPDKITFQITFKSTRPNGRTVHFEFTPLNGKTCFILVNADINGNIKISTQNSSPVRKGFTTNGLCLKNNIKRDEIDANKAAAERKFAQQQAVRSRVLPARIGGHVMPARAPEKPVAKEAASVIASRRSHGCGSGQVQQVNPDIELQIFRDAIASVMSESRTLEDKIAIAFELRDQHSLCIQQNAFCEIVSLCQSTLRTCTREILQELATLDVRRPRWFCDDMWDRMFCVKPLEHAWQNYQYALQLLSTFLSKLDLTHPMPSSDITNLYEVRVACQEVINQAEQLSHMGFDHMEPGQSVDLARSEFNRLHDTVKHVIAISDRCIQYAQVRYTYPAAQFIRTCSMPQFLPDNAWKWYIGHPDRPFESNQQVWQHYVSDIRAFVIEHYQSNMSSADIEKACPVPSDAQSCHDFLVRKLVRLCRLKDDILPAYDSSGTVDEAYADELRVVHDEIGAIGSCLMQMISIVRTGNGYPAPDVTPEEINTIKLAMESEAKKDCHDAKYKKDIPAQVIGVLVDSARFVAHVAVSNLLRLGAAADSAGTMQAQAGPFKITLRAPEQDDSSRLLLSIRRAFQRVSQAKCEQAVIRPPVARSSKAASGPVQVHQDAGKIAGKKIQMIPVQQAPQQKQADSCIIAADTMKGTGTIPVLYDLIAATPAGVVAVDSVTPEQLQKNFATAQTFLAKEAAKEQVAGNTTFAQELRDVAQYSGECLKTLIQRIAHNFYEKVKGAAKYDLPCAHIINLVPPRHRDLPVEQKYRGIVQEYCAYIGGKLGDLAPNILIMLLTCNAGNMGPGATPPMAVVPHGEVVLVAAADSAGTMQAQAGPFKITLRAPEQDDSSRLLLSTRRAFQRVSPAKCERAVIRPPVARSSKAASGPVQVHQDAGKIAGKKIQMIPVQKAPQPKQADSCIIAADTMKGTENIPVLYDPVATTPDGTVSVNAVTQEQLQKNLAAASDFFNHKTEFESGHKATLPSLSESELYQYVSDIFTQCGTRLDDYSRRMISTWIPGIANGVTQWVVNNVNPVNAMLAASYAKIFVVQLSGYVFHDMVYLARYNQLKTTDPAAAAQLLEKCYIKKVSSVFSSLDEKSRIELVTQVTLDICAGEKIRKLQEKGAGAILDHVGGKLGIDQDLVKKGKALLAAKPLEQAANIIEKAEADGAKVAKNARQEIQKEAQQIEKNAAASAESKAAKAGKGKPAVAAEAKTVSAAKKVTLTEIAKDLKCNESDALKQMKAYFSNGVVKDNRVEAMIDADTKIVFRKDFGEKYAHALPPGRGYPAGVKIDHYNIDIVKRRVPGTLIDRWDKVEVFHIVFDADGKNIIDFF